MENCARYKRRFAALAFCGAFAVAAYASDGSDTAEVSPSTQSDDSQERELDKFVVTANRIGEANPLEEAVNSTYIDRNKIENSSAVNVVDILEKQANVRFRSVVGSNAAADLSMRGFGENSQTRVLVMVDGQKFNRPDMGAINWLQLPLSDIESVEVLRGSMSVLYGSAAALFALVALIAARRFKK